MFPLEVPVQTADDVARLVRALGAHRYVKARLLAVHAFAVAAAAPDVEALAEHREWAEGALAQPGLDLASPDSRLIRALRETEVGALIGAFWRDDDVGDRVRNRLVDWLERGGFSLSDATPFDETVETAIQPLLIDAGWELFSLAELDSERHRGAITAFGEADAFARARSTEAASEAPRAYLQELPAFGPVELLGGLDDFGRVGEAFALWAEGPRPYHDYIVRGAIRAAKLTT